MPGSIAPLVMGWQRRMGAVASPFSATGETSNGDPVQVEAFINGVWTDITSYVMVRDDSGNISASRGRRDEGSTTEQSTCQLLLNNRDGRWSPRNPTGPYYGFIGRNTTVRVSVPDGLGGKSYRFQGEISVWPQSWDPTGTDVWTEVEAAGILRRLSQGPASAHSLLYDTLTHPIPSSIRAYWPCEDAAESPKLASALVSGSAMTYTGSPTLAGYDGFPASDPVPDMGSTVLSGGVTTYADPTATQVRFLCFIPSDGLTNGTVVCAIDQTDYSAGSAQFFEIYYGNNGGTGHGLTLHTCASDGTDLGADLENTFDVRGKKLYISIEFQESGTGISRALRIYDLTAGISYDATDTETLTQLTRVTKVQFGPASRSVSSPHGSTGLSSCAIGHVTVEDAITSNTILGVRLNPIGETAGRRIQRVCDTNAIAFESIGDLDDTVAMGNQGKINPLDLMQEAELADAGMLYESMSILGLGYRTRNSLCNQDAQLTLNYTGFNLSEVPTPVEDDRYIQNQVTVTVNDVSQTYALSTGALSTQPPPAGVGIYGADVPLNLASSGAALAQAAWRVHMGTVDEPRYPQISVNLAHSTFTANPALKQAVLGLKQGDRVVIQNMPSWLPPGDVDQIILGFEETINNFEHRITFVCAPASPYRVGVVDNSIAVVDTDGSELAVSVSSGATSIDVQPSEGQSGLWTTDSANMPVDIAVGGEVMRVSSIAPSVSDAFGRTSSNGWGNADTGQVWTNAGGAASDFAVAAGVGTHTLTSVDVSRRVFLPAAYNDFDLYVNITTSAAATGAPIYGGPVGRYTDIDNLYMARLSFTTTNTLVLYIVKRYGGAESNIATANLTDTYVPGTFYTIRFQATGVLLRAKAWAAGGVETPEWQVSVSDSALLTTTSIGLRSILEVGNTNVSPVVSYDSFQLVNPQTFTVSRSINGVVKSQTAGTDIRLAYPTIISL